VESSSRSSSSRGGEGSFRESTRGANPAGGAGASSPRSTPRHPPSEQGSRQTPRHAETPDGTVVPVRA